MKKILVILCHPNYDSLNGFLFDSYIRGAKDFGFEVRSIKLGEIKFDPVLWKGYKKIQDLESDLVNAQKDLLWAEHIVFVFPTWWGGPPALLKGFIDRTILPGFAFKYKQDSILWDKYFKGKSSRVIVTMDGPKFFYKLIGSPGITLMKKSVLNFIGIDKVRTTIFSRVKMRDEEEMKKWIDKVYKLGRKGV